MTRDEVRAIHAAELARQLSGPAAEAAERERLLREIDLERPRLVADAERDQPEEDRRKAKSALARLDAKRAAVEARPPPLATLIETYALQGTRTRVHEALQAAEPPPTAREGEVQEDLQDRQKRHGRGLWARTDQLVRDAGLLK